MHYELLSKALKETNLILLRFAFYNSRLIWSRIKHKRFMSSLQLHLYRKICMHMFKGRVEMIKVCMFEGKGINTASTLISVYGFYCKEANLSLHAYNNGANQPVYPHRPINTVDICHQESNNIT